MLRFYVCAQPYKTLVDVVSGFLFNWGTSDSSAGCFFKFVLNLVVTKATSLLRDCCAKQKKTTCSLHVNDGHRMWIYCEWVNGPSCNCQTMIWSSFTLPFKRLRRVWVCGSLYNSSHFWWWFIVCAVSSNCFEKEKKKRLPDADPRVHTHWWLQFHIYDRCGLMFLETNRFKTFE